MNTRSDEILQEQLTNTGPDETGAGEGGGEQVRGLRVADTSADRRPGVSTTRQCVAHTRTGVHNPPRAWLTRTRVHLTLARACLSGV